MTIADTLRQLGLASPDPRSDGELVSRFVANRDEPAFVELFRRHGPMVYGVCRRVLGNTPDADDAFQAVFLVLARSAASVRPPGMVGNWLYGVAVRTANKARVMNAKKVNRRGGARGGGWEPPGYTPRGRPPAPPPPAGSPDRDTLAVIDAELAALPDMYRAAFVTCELNGRSRAEASRELGWPEGTLAARLAKARELLAVRLTKRGVTLGAGLFAAVAVPPATATETISAVRELLSAGTASAVAPAAQTLSDEVAKTMSTNYAKWLLLGGMVLTLAGGGAVLLAAPGDTPSRQQIKAPVPKAAESEWKEVEPITFKDGGRVTSIAFAPSGKTIAVVRADGKIDFFDPTTRKHQQSMDFLGDPKSNPKREGGTAPAIAFRPTPHAKLGDVFAITHKNGVNFGTTGIGLMLDEPEAAAEGVPPNWELKGADPRQLVWLSEAALVTTNGKGVAWRVRDDRGWGRYEWEQAGEIGQVNPLATLPGDDKVFLSNGEKGGNELHFVGRPVLSQPKVLTGHKARPIAAACAADGRRIVSADEGGTLIVWEGEKREFKEIRRVELGEGVVQLALAPDGKTAAVVRRKEEFIPIEWPPFQLELLVFDVTDPPVKPKPIWSTVLKSRGFSKGPVSLAFSPDGKTLLTAFADPYINDKDAKSMGVKVWELVPKK